MHDIFLNYIQTSSGKQWLAIAKELHHSEEDIFIALINSYLRGTCAGWSRSLIKSFSTNSKSSSDNLIGDVSCDDIIFHTLQERLASKSCLVPTDVVEAKYQDLFQKKEVELKPIRNEAFEYRHSITGMDSLQQFPYWKAKSFIDLREAKYEVFMQHIEKYLLPFENEKRPICARITIHFGDTKTPPVYAHEVFAQLNGDYYRLCCNEKGLFEFPNRAEWHRGFNRYIQNLSQPIARVEFHFYVPTSIKNEKLE